MKAEEKQISKSSRHYLLKRSARFSIALASVVVLSFLVWQAYSIYQLSAVKIYNKSYVPYHLQAEEIGADSALTPIEFLYVQKDYKAILPETKIVTSVSERDKLLIGIACLEADNYLPAVSWLNRVTINPQSPYLQPAQFYLALTHIINEDYDRALEYMQLIVDNPAHAYHKQFNKQMIKQMQLLKWK